MPEFAFQPSVQANLPIAGRDELFPVRRVYCVGRNYAAHAVEMGHDPDREAPFFFQKNPDNLTADGKFRYPRQSSDVHHEVELYLALSGGGDNLSIDNAHDLLFGAGVAIDMTCRDIQAEAKAKGRPWTMAKAFEGSAPAGPVHPMKSFPADGDVTLSVNGALRQKGRLDQMIWKPAEIIAELSRAVTLAAGDVILTGTPAGVGPVLRGETMTATISGFEPLNVRVV